MQLRCYQEIISCIFQILIDFCLIDFDYWFDMAKCLFAGEYGKIDYEKGEKTVEMLLVKLAKMEVSIKID